MLLPKNAVNLNLVRLLTVQYEGDQLDRLV